MQHVYSTHVRDLHKTIHFTCKACMVTQLLCTVLCDLSIEYLSIEYWGVILNLMYKKASLSDVLCMNLIAFARVEHCNPTPSKSLREVSALKLEENDILVGHGYHTAGSEPYFFINSYTYTKQLGAIPVDLNGSVVWQRR